MRDVPCTNFNDEDFPDDEMERPEHPFDVIMGMKYYIAGILMIALAVAYALMVASTPEIGYVFEGNIVKITPKYITVYVRNNQTLAEFNSTIGMCYDEPYKFICRVGDRVELTEYISIWNKVFVITALVD